MRRSTSLWLSALMGLVLFGLPSWSHAQVAHNNSNTMARSGAASPVTETTFSVSAGSNLCGVSWIALKQTGSATIPTASVTWNGVSMTQAGTGWDSTNGVFIAGYTLSNPATGTHNMVFTFAPGAGGTITDLYYELSSYTGADQSGTCVRTSSFSTAMAQTANSSKQVFITVSNSLTNDVVTDAWVQFPTTQANGAGTSWTQRGNNTGGNFNSFTTADTVSTGTSMQDTVTNFNASVCCTGLAGFSIKQLAAAGGASNTFIGVVYH